jgi:lipid II:glycine glycyltransferase (peptidoglycan interpeptide bridge formation enzyme)
MPELDPWPADGAIRIKTTPPTAWDEHTVDQPNGHVYQSLEWAAHRAASGWEPRYVVVPGGPGVLALLRPWPQIGGFSAYLPRGPIPTVSPPDDAARLVEIATRLAGEGVDVVASDAEQPASAAYATALAAAGFRPIEEIQPSRHKVALPIEGRTEDELFGAISKSTRQRIRKAEETVEFVVRHDGRLPASGVGDGFTPASEPVEVALDRFYDLLLETGERKHFSFGPREAFTAWWRSALRAGHLVLLEAFGIRGLPVAGLLLYRHGNRLSTVHSGDHAEDRDETPGALHLLRWRAIQLAIREGRDEMDLGGADVAGARREPQEGEPTYGLYQHKRSFGAVWVELAGAHEKVIRANHYRAGRVMSKLSRLLDRRPTPDEAAAEE